MKDTDIVTIPDIVAAERWVGAEPFTVADWRKSRFAIQQRPDTFSFFKERYPITWMWLQIFDQDPVRIPADVASEARDAMRGIYLSTMSQRQLQEWASSAYGALLIKEAGPKAKIFLQLFLPPAPLARIDNTKPLPPCETPTCKNVRTTDNSPYCRRCRDQVMKYGQVISIQQQVGVDVEMPGKKMDWAGTMERVLIERKEIEQMAIQKESAKKQRLQASLAAANAMKAGQPVKAVTEAMQKAETKYLAFNREYPPKYDNMRNLDCKSTMKNPQMAGGYTPMAVGCDDQSGDDL